MSDAAPCNRVQHITYGGAVGVCEKGRWHQQALHLLRVMQRHAVGPDVITYKTAISA